MLHTNPEERRREKTKIQSEKCELHAREHQANMLISTWSNNSSHHAHPKPIWQTKKPPELEQDNAQ
jgi:hypothetical protein